MFKLNTDYSTKQLEKDLNIKINTDELLYGYIELRIDNNLYELDVELMGSITSLDYSTDYIFIVRDMIKNHVPIDYIDYID